MSKIGTEFIASKAAMERMLLYYCQEDFVEKIVKRVTPLSRKERKVILEMCKKLDRKSRIKLSRASKRSRSKRSA